MSTNEAAAPAVDDDYVVKLPSGDARVMSIDELDAALEAGTIHKDSPVLAPGTVTWTTLGVLAGLDDEPALSSASPAFDASAFDASAFSIPSPSSVAPMVMGPTDLDDDDSAVLRPRRRAGRAVKVVVAAFCALAIVAVGFAIKSAVTQTLATRAAEAALAAQPAAAPPPAPVAPPPVVVQVQAAPPVAPAPASAAAAASSPASTKASAVAVTAKNKDKKKTKLPGAPSPSKKK